MTKKRNGLLEIYRLILCFWPMYHHGFFFFERDHGVFTEAQLTVDFFFVLSGLFLIRGFERLKEEKIFSGAGKIMLQRIKPMSFTLCFLISFGLVCTLLFIKDNHINTLFEIFKYWWYVLYMVITVGIYFIAYRLIKNKKIFALVLLLIVVVMCIIHYQAAVKGRIDYIFTYIVKSFGCIALGMLLSYIPVIKPKKFNFNIPLVIILFAALIFLCYGQKTYNLCVVMILMFCALVYFSLGISVEGRIFELMGKLSLRMYLYMSFATVLYYLGITNHRQLFVIDVFLAVADLILDEYRNRYYKLKGKL